MIDDQLITAFDDCLTRLKAGESIASCLHSYPNLASDLRPMLEAAQAAIAVSVVPHAAQMRSRANFLTAAVQHKPQRSFAGWWRGLSTALAIAGTAFMVWLGFSVVTNTVLSPSTETPTVTWTASPTQTAVDTATVEPTPTTPAPSVTPSPTASATVPPPTATHTASATQVPPTHTPSPTSIPPTAEQTPVPNVTDDHGGDGTTEPGDDHGGQSGTSDDSGGDNSGSGSGDGGGDDSGGHGGDD